MVADPLKLTPVRRFALRASPISLALDEGADVAGHLTDQQTHRDVGEGQSDGERGGEGESDCGECGERRHLLTSVASGVPRGHPGFQPGEWHSRTWERSCRMSNGFGITRNTGLA
jgi:hypothetical protein